MKFNLKDKIIVDFDGTPARDEKGQTLLVRTEIARALAYDRDQSRDPVKLYELSRRFIENEVVDLDTSDRDIVIAVIKSAGGIALSKGQIILALRAE